MVILDTIGTVVTFGTSVAFWYTEDIESAFSTLGVIPSEF